MDFRFLIITENVRDCLLLNQTNLTDGDESSETTRRVLRGSGNPCHLNGDTMADAVHSTRFTTVTVVLAVENRMAALEQCLSNVHMVYKSINLVCHCV